MASPNNFSATAFLRGSVALLKHSDTTSEGKLVVLLNREKATPPRSCDTRPSTRWQVLVLGDAIWRDNRPCRHVVIGECAMQLVGHLSKHELEDVLRYQALCDFDAAMDEVLRIVERRKLTPEQLDAAIGRATVTLEIERALEVLNTESLLREMGFASLPPDGESVMEWNTSYRGTPLKVMAGPDMFGSTWGITGKCIQARSAMWDERRVLNEEPRGKLALLVLDLWREAFGNLAPVPEQLQIALIYEQHRRDKAAVHIGLPTLYVDGEVFRACRRWLAERHAGELESVKDPSAPSLKLKFDGAMLHLETHQQHFACPAQGGWVEDCEVPLRTLVDAAPRDLRGGWLRLTRYLDYLTLQSHPLPLMNPQCDEGAG
jgi:hypothetical protein